MRQSQVNEIRIIEKNMHKRLEEKLKEAYRQQDILLYSLERVEKRSAFLFFLINMVLMIWLSQTVLSSNLKEIPRSIYLLSPLFSRAPLQNIEVSTDGRCPSNYRQLNFMTLPSITSLKQAHQNVTKWREKQVTFCGQPLQYVLETPCPNGYLKCSGYCIHPNYNCPITSIRRISNLMEMEKDEEVFYKIPSVQLFYVFSRRDGRSPVVDIFANIQEPCANQFFWDDQFSTLEQFSGKIREGCGVEGTIDDIYEPIDSIPTRIIFQNNGYILNTPDAENISFNSGLGYVKKIRIDSQNPYCKGVIEKAKELEKTLPANPVLPSLAQILLITSLIYMVLSLAWLISYSFSLFKYLNGVAVVLSIIEMMHIIVMNNKYSKYLRINGLFQIQNCVQDSTIDAFKQWRFGIGDVKIFETLLFANTVFLALQCVSWIFLRTVYRRVQRLDF